MAPAWDGADIRLDLGDNEERRAVLMTPGCVSAGPSLSVVAGQLGKSQGVGLCWVLPVPFAEARREEKSLPLPSVTLK